MGVDVNAVWEITQKNLPVLKARIEAILKSWKTHNFQYDPRPAEITIEKDPCGLEKNRANLERFVGYSLDQGLMAKKMAVEELFLALN